MKVIRHSKFVLVAVVVCAVLVGTCFPVAAFTAEEELPHVTRWVNGAAQSDTGTYLFDTWAIDDTGVADSKYVLIGQDSVEAMRVANYPDDISKGETSFAPTYSGVLSLAIPDEVNGEVVVTIENEGALYTVSFNGNNSYKANVSFLPGVYKVTGVEVLGKTGDTFRLAENMTFTVADNDFTAKIKLISTASDVSSSGEQNGNGVRDTVTGFDRNGDLAGDTVKMAIAVAVLFIGYSLIKRKREKAEEINK